MEESSRCKFQLGEEADPHGTNERIMIVNASSAGDLVQGVQNIMHQLLNNPRVRVYTNVTTVYDSSIPAGMQNSSSGMAPLANPPVPMGMGMGPPSGPTAGLPSVVPPNGMMYAPASMLQVGGYQVQSVPYPAAAASMMMTSIPAQQVHPVNMNVPGAHTNNTGKMMAQPQVGVVSASNGPGSGVPAGYPQYAMVSLSSCSFNFFFFYIAFAYYQHQQGMYGQHAQMYGGTGAQNPYMQQGQQQGQTPQQQAVSQPTPTQTTATAGMYTYQQPPPQQQQQGAPATATGYPNAQQILQGYHSMQPALAETAQAGMAQGQQVMQQQPISGVQAAPQGVFQQGMMMMMPPQGQGQGMMQPGMPMQLQQHQHPQQGMPYGVPPQGMPHQQGMMMMTPQQQQYAMMTSAGPYAAAAQPAYGGASSFQSQQQAQPAQQQQQYGAQYNQQYQYYDPNLAQAGSYGGYTGAGTGKKR